MSKYTDADALIKRWDEMSVRGRTEFDQEIMVAPSIDICFCRECKWEWTQKCPPHRMGLIHDESDYCSYGVRKGAEDE